MTHEVTVRSVASRHIVAVRERRKWGQLGGALIPLLDRVYAAVRAKQVIQTGHNVFVFRDGSPDGVTVEVGVEGSFVADASEVLVAVLTPAGEAAATVHRGPYSGLGAAHEAIVRWCPEHDRRHANVWWEVYGDWHEDEARLETEVFYALDPRPPSAR